jgi:raffinose/stachyose/melibiose transport system permease protein
MATYTSGIQKKNFAPGQVIMLIVLFIIAAIQIFPLIWLLNFSVASSTEMFTQGILIKPERLRWDNYYKAFTDGHFMLYFRNSILVNALSVLLVLVISVMAAFACTRMRWRFASLVRNFLLLGMMIPIHATILPNYIIYNGVHLTDTLWAILIPYVAFSLPQGLFLTSGYMESIPREIEEAAIIDGCGIFRLIAVIITPMLQVSLVTVSIMTFLNNWNEFIMAMTFLSSRTWKTLPFSILEFTGQYRSDYAVQFAVMALTAAPAVLIYIILNKHITKGVALGAVKG